MGRWMEKKARPIIRVAQGFRVIVGTNSGFCGLAILTKKNDQKYSES